MTNDDALDRIFRTARTHRAFLDRPVPESLLRQVYELAALGPTSANCSPMRVLFATSREAKERLRPCLTPGNVDKTMQAPVTAIIGHDLEFYEHLPKLFAQLFCFECRLRRCQREQRCDDQGKAFEPET